MPTKSPAAATWDALTARFAGSPPKWPASPAGGWWLVATYADRWPSARTDRPGLVRLLADAGFGAFDLVAMDGLARLAPDRVSREALRSWLASVGARVVDLRPSGVRRLAAVVGDLALADLIGEAAR